MRLTSIVRNFLLVSAAMLIVAVGSFAQSGTTSLRGTVLDKSGASVGDAKGTLDNPAQAFHREAQTGANGGYEFLSLPPSTYVLTVEKVGFQKFEQSNLQLLVNLPGTVNPILEIGSASQVVE